MSEPIKAIKSGDGASESAGRPSAPARSINPIDLIAASAVPSILISSDDDLMAANGPGEQLARGWRAAQPALISAVRSARAHASLCALTWTQEPPHIDRSIDLLAIPMAQGDVLLTGRDLTLERKLAANLMASRERFGAFLQCAADFAWETDADGRFTYITPGGAVGLGPEDMLGRRAETIFAPVSDQPDPFRAHGPMEVATYWVALRGDETKRAAFRLAARPRFDRDGRWTGARGIGLNVTESAAQETARALEQARQSLIAQILLAVRSDAAPEKILQAVAQSLPLVTKARGGWCLLSRGKVRQRRGLDGAGPLGQAAAKLNELADWSSETEPLVELFADTVLTARVGSGGTLAAALLLSRDADKAPWRAYEIDLVTQVMSQIGIALRQAALIERLKRLSRVDDLTELLNRRAFMEELERRLAHHRRTGRPGALMYVDLDHFKAVNDTMGHAVGDKVLGEMGRLLRESIRVGDAAGRLGGDEFAVWLEETDAKGAAAKAQALLEEVAGLRRATGDPQSDLGLSVGIAISHPEREETLEGLAERADRALYAVKRSGRGRYAFADGDQQ
ncbi:MAG: diguanylate cyclase domain-containing protein [Rhodothalassiaceae bacterium]